MPRSAALVGLVATLAAAPGCAMVAAGFASEGHPGGCSTSKGPASVDLVLGGLSTLMLAGTGKLDDSMGWIALPAVFVGSALVGAIAADRCESHASSGAPVAYTAPAPRPSPPPEPALAPDQRDATPEEIGLPAPQLRSAPPPALRLAPGYELPDPPPPPPEPAAAIACSVEPALACPDRMYCQLEGEHGGHCVAMP